MHNWIRKARGERNSRKQLPTKTSRGGGGGGVVALSSSKAREKKNKKTDASKSVTENRPPPQTFNMPSIFAAMRLCLRLDCRRNNERQATQAILPRHDIVLQWRRLLPPG